MKKNYFYATVQEEFSLLLSAVRSGNGSGIEELRDTCARRHRSLCLHLLRDFITPVAREDLYAVSDGILAVFSTLFALSDTERKIAEQSVLLLASDPFRFDETRLRCREDLQDLWESSPCRSAAADRCFGALDLLAERLLLTAVRNA